MTTLRPNEPLDDEALGAIVRDTVSQWAMPPVRLDAPSWRERVRTPRVRRVAALREAVARTGQAASAALVLTVAAALLGVYLSSQGPGKPGPSPSSSARQTQRPRPSSVAASPLPQLFLPGPLAGPTRVLVSDEGVFEVLDLSTGTVKGTIGSGRFGNEAWVRADGTIVCLCLAGDGFSRNGEASVTVSVQHYAADGTWLATSMVGIYRGAPDPRDPVTGQTPADASVSIARGPTEATAYVGWTVHAHPVWRSGIDVVDLDDGHVIQQLALPDRDDGQGTQRVAPDAPRPLGIGGDGRLVIAQTWQSWSPPAATNPDSNYGSDAFTAKIDGTRLSDGQALDGARECGLVFAAGARPGGAGTWLACPSPRADTTRLRLISNTGAVTDVDVNGPLIGTGEGAASTVSPDGRWLYLWDATSLRLTRVDLSNGASTTVTGATASAWDLLTALGQWLAPPAAAKVILSPGLVLSPDGARLYALGVEMASIQQNGFAGSTGVLVFDAASMTQVDRWAPTADFVSIAVSADGSLVYAAGSPTVGTDGTTTNQPASVTVFDAASGTVRAIAGSLGQGLLTFPNATLP